MNNKQRLLLNLAALLLSSVVAPAHAALEAGNQFDAFPHATNHWFWMSSPYSHCSGSAWIIRFDTGFDANGGNQYAARLARGG